MAENLDKDIYDGIPPFIYSGGPEKEPTFKNIEDQSESKYYKGNKYKFRNSSVELDKDDPIFLNTRNRDLLLPNQHGITPFDYPGGTGIGGAADAIMRGWYKHPDVKAPGYTFPKDYILDEVESKMDVTGGVYSFDKDDQNLIQPIDSEGKTSLKSVLKSGDNKAITQPYGLHIGFKKGYEQLKGKAEPIVGFLYDANEDKSPSTTVIKEFSPAMSQGFFTASKAFVKLMSKKDNSIAYLGLPMFGELPLDKMLNVENDKKYMSNKDLSIYYSDGEYKVIFNSDKYDDLLKKTKLYSIDKSGHVTRGVLVTPQVNYVHPSMTTQQQLQAENPNNKEPSYDIEFRTFENGEEYIKPKNMNRNMYRGNIMRQELNEYRDHLDSLKRNAFPVQLRNQQQPIKNKPIKTSQESHKPHKPGFFPDGTRDWTGNHDK